MSASFRFVLKAPSHSEASLYIPASIKGCFGNWALGIWAYGTHCNELLERPPNNSFPVRSCTMPKARIRYPKIKRLFQ